jgi:hypothetical protein
MNYPNLRKILFLKILSILSILLLVFVEASPARASAELRVYIGGESSTVYPALDWAGWGVFILVDDPDRADVLLLNGAIPDPERVRSRLEAGAGLVLILGRQISSEQFSRATNVPVTLEPADAAVHPVEIAVVGEDFQWQVEWETAPAVRERSRVMTPVSSVQPLVAGRDDGDWLIWSLPGGTAFIVDFYLGMEENTAFRGWEYYNYLIYSLVARAGGREPLDFAEYPGAVLPGTSGSGPLLFALALLAAVGLTVFFVVRRLRAAPPEGPNSNSDGKTGQDSQD